MGGMVHALYGLLECFLPFSATVIVVRMWSCQGTGHVFCRCTVAALQLGRASTRLHNGMSPTPSPGRVSQVKAESSKVWKFIMEREIEAPARFQAIQTHRATMAIIRQQARLIWPPCAHLCPLSFVEWLDEVLASQSLACSFMHDHGWIAIYFGIHLEGHAVGQ